MSVGARHRVVTREDDFFFLLSFIYISKSTYCTIFEWFHELIVLIFENTIIIVAIFGGRSTRQMAGSTELVSVQLTVKLKSDQNTL